MKFLSVIISVILLSACASTEMTARLAEGKGGIPTNQFSDARTVEDIRALRPQAKFPLKIAVMPPRWRGLSLEEREIIEKWGYDIKSLGFADSLEIVPKTLVLNCNDRRDRDCFLQNARTAAARMGADAILVLNDITVTDAYVNPLSILNLTIIGMWVAPAHHRESYSVYEASLFDINNGYLYAVAEGNGEHKMLRPFMYVEYDSGQHEARLEALNNVGFKLFDLAKEQMERLKSSNNGN